MKSSNPEKSPRFQSTQWSLVFKAGGASLAAQRAMESLCEIYWYPLYAFARRRGCSTQQSEDLTQGFFVRLFEKEYLQLADPERGRFRSFLLTIFKRFMGDEADKANALKRGGGVDHISIDFPAAERRYQAEPTTTWTPDALYERRWALTLLERVLQQLRVTYESNGKTQFFDATQAFLTGDGPPYEDVAITLGMKPGTVRVAVSRLRSQYRSLLREEVSRTLLDADDCENELAVLRRAIRGES